MNPNPTIPGIFNSTVDLNSVDGSIDTKSTPKTDAPSIETNKTELRSIHLTQIEADQSRKIEQSTELLNIQSSPLLEFESLYQRYNRELWALAYARWLDADMAMDVVQEAFFRYWKQLEFFRNEKAALEQKDREQKNREQKNREQKNREQKNREQKDSKPVENLKVGESSGVSPEVPEIREGIQNPRAWLTRVVKNLAEDYVKSAFRKNGTHPPQFLNGVKSVESSPLERMEKEETLDQLRVALSELPEGDREILTLRYTLDYDSMQIADILGINASAVHMRLSRARQRLADRLTAEGMKDQS